MGKGTCSSTTNIKRNLWPVTFLHSRVSFSYIISFEYRYIDDIFFTSNESLNSINQMLDEANQSHPNIKLTREIGINASFVDVFIAYHPRVVLKKMFSVKTNYIFGISMMNYPRPRRDLERVPLTISKKKFNNYQWENTWTERKKNSPRTGFEPVSRLIYAH